MNKTRLGKSELHDVIRSVLSNRKRGVKSWRVVELVLCEIGKRYSDASITARMREMRDIKCDLTSHTYKLIEIKKARVIK